MTEVRDLLNRVWSAFRSVGIADDLTIIEHIARLLLDESGLASPAGEELPKLPPVRLNTDSIRENLRQAANQVGGFAKLFDRHVLFRLPTMLPGGRYPTPRHIVQFMLRLAQFKPTHSLGDFACGSAGLLVYRPSTDSEQLGQTVGIDISPEWARLARANVLLHGTRSIYIRDGNALQVLGEEASRAVTFDRILMNPPFGTNIDAQLAEILLGRKVGSRSETALTALALQKLAPGGRAAVLVPSGLLFSNSTADKTLRTQLVNENTLEAVIRFPRDAFQPYSPLQTNLLLFSKGQPVEGHLTWFFQVEQDGYPGGRSRDLTQDPPQSSDLPFLERVILNFTTDSERLLPDEENSLIGVRTIMNGSTFLGFVCRGISTELTAIDFYPQFDTKSPLLIVETTTAAQHCCVQIPIDGNQEPSLVENQLNLIQERKRKSNPDPGRRLLSHPVRMGAIAIAPVSQAATIPIARLLGVAVESTAIEDQSFELRPERYIGKQEESRVTDSPTQLLARIYRNQRELSGRINSLFGRLELPAIANQQIPSPLEDLKPFGTLSPEQRVVWEKVREKTELINPEQPDNGLTAVHFIGQDVDSSDTGEVSDTTRLTLELLERMGLVVLVTIAQPTTEEADTDEPVALYRRVTKRDLWQLDLGVSDSRGESP